MGAWPGERSRRCNYRRGTVRGRVPGGWTRSGPDDEARLAFPETLIRVREPDEDPRCIREENRALDTGVFARHGGISGSGKDPERAPAHRRIVA